VLFRSLQKARRVEPLDAEHRTGLMPAGAAAAAAGAMLGIEGFDSSRLLELRLLEGLDSSG